MMTNEERSAWTRRVMSLPFHEALAMIVEEFLRTGDATLIGFRSPESASEWEFNSRLETLQGTFERFERPKLGPISTEGSG